MTYGFKLAAVCSVVLAAACDRGPAPAKPAPFEATSPASGSVVAAPCAEPGPGCACKDGSAPRACFPPPQHQEDGSMLCAKGTMACRGGAWSTCESLTSFSMKEPAGKPQPRPQPNNLGVQASALITQPTVCNLCNPDCYAARDRPTDEDLVIGNSGVVVYDADVGGVQLKPIVDVNQRGPIDTPAVCGNGVLEGVEICDDGNTFANDGCGADCRLEDGWHCPTVNASCRRSVCGDGVKEGTEQCDDGNLQIGDGCTPFCALEPTCSGGVCQALCGDGKVMPGEGCDDGNTRSGDGCSSTCTLEAGFDCQLRSPTPPPHMDLPIVYRDLRRGHPDFQAWCCGMDLGMVANTWGPDRKPLPVIAVNNALAISSPAHNPSLSTAANFHQWYHDDPSANLTYADKLRVVRQNDGTYVFDSASFFPLTGRGFTAQGEAEHKDNHGNLNNFHFTSEVRFWFEYVPGQVLTFRGDDDVWVFINGRLAVDLGGVHGATAGSVTLNATSAAKYGLTPGGLYEAAVFQAERHTVQSNYRLQLGGFFFGRTECRSVCGDSIVTNDEVCDDGINDGRAGGCQSDCKARVKQYAENGAYWRNYDATQTCSPLERPTWGELSWDVETPGDSTVLLELRTAQTAAAVSSATAVSIDLSKRPNKGSTNATSELGPGRSRDPYLRVTAVLKVSSDQKQSPVLREFALRYRCKQEE